MKNKIAPTDSRFRHWQKSTAATLAILSTAISITACTAINNHLGFGDPADVSMPPPSLTPEIYRPLVNLAVDASENGRPEEARKRYNEIIDKDPSSAEADYCRGELARLDDKNSEAIRFFDSALAKNPQLETAYNDRGNCYRALNMVDKSITDYSIAMLLGPGPVHWVCRARSYILKKEFLKAMQDATVAINKDANYAAAYATRAQAWEGLKNFKQTENDYNQAITVAKVPTRFYYKRGSFYLEQGQPQKARLDFAAAVKGDPTDGDYHYWLGEADMALQDYASARADFEEYKKLSEAAHKEKDVKIANNWLAQINTEEYDQLHKAKSLKQQWALACSAQLFLQNEDGLCSLSGEEPTPENIEREKSSLLSWWNISTREQLLSTLENQLNDGHDPLWREYHAIIKRGNPAEKLEKLAHNPIQIIQLDNRMELVRKYGDKFGDRGLLAWDLCRYISLCRWGYRVGWLSEDEAYARIMPVARQLQTKYSSWKQLGEEYLVGRQFWNMSQYEKDKKESEEVLHRLLTWEKSPWVYLPWKTKLE